MDYRPLNDAERSQLINSLRGNAQGNQVLSSWTGATPVSPARARRSPTRR
jgi:hypothetical protein